jgi:dipeptidyl aminopeptidase/acylaminoacyl peptidase
MIDYKDNSKYNKTRIFINITVLIILTIFIFSCSYPKDNKYSQIKKMIHDQFPMYVKISSDGNKLLLKNKIGEVFELLISNIHGSEPEVIDRSNFSQLSLTWNPNEEEIIFQEFNYKTKMYDLYKVGIISKKRCLLPLPASNNAIPPLRWSKDGKYLAYIATAGNSNLYVFEYNKNEIKNIFANMNPYSDFQWSGDSTLFFIENPKSPILKQVDIFTNEIREYGLSKYGEVKNFSIKGEKVLFIGREIDKQYFQCYELDLENGDIKRKTEKNYNISSCRYSNNNFMFFYNQNENGINRLYCSDSIINDCISKLEEPQGSLQIDLENMNDLFLNHSSFYYPSELLKFNLKNSEKEILYKPGNSDYLRLEKPDFVEIERENSNLTINGYFWKAENANVRNKTIIYLHGGPFLQSDPLWNIQSKLFNKYGFNVFSINYHGSSGYSDEFANKNNEFDQVLDVVASVKYLKTKFHVKEENIIIVGSSYGGKLALRACDYINNIGGIVLISGVLPEDNGAFQNLRKTKILGFYGEMDPLSLDALNFFKRYNLIRPDVENFMLFKKEGHFFHRSSSWTDVYGKIIESFSELNRKR